MNSKIIIIGLIILGGLYFCGHYFFYGSLINNCIYTEEKIAVPEKLMHGDIVVVKDAYIAVGYDKEYSCLKNFGSINKEIVGPETINNITVGVSYFTSRGLKVEALKKGTSFQVVDVIAITKHGISTIDSGAGPINFLILKDQDNILYKIATVEFGINEGDLFLSFVDSSQPANSVSAKLLSDSSFSGNDEKDPFAYTGELTELTNSFLENTNPQWEKLSDRLENGEKFLIRVDIELRDDSFNEIVLSDNRLERSAQIAQIQNNILKKIPSNLVLKNVEKDESWPFISMEANFDLLNYFIDEQATLKIKNISELIKKF